MEKTTAAPRAFKINNLVNLQDARYCAAMQVSHLSFCLARGSLYKLPEKLTDEIIGWLSGPELVLNYADDLAGAYEFAPGLYVEGYILELQLPPDDAERLSDAEAAAVGLRLVAPETALPAFYAQALDLAPRVRYLELTGSRWDAAHADELARLCKRADNLIVDLDWAPVDAVQALDAPPFGLAARKCIEEDFTQLDYDKTEALLERLGLAGDLHP